MLRKQVLPSLPSLSTRGQTCTNHTYSVRSRLWKRKGEGEVLESCRSNVSWTIRRVAGSCDKTALVMSCPFQPQAGRAINQADLGQGFFLSLSLSLFHSHTHTRTHTYTHTRTKIHSERVFLLCLHSHSQTCTQALLSS